MMMYTSYLFYRGGIISGGGYLRGGLSLGYGVYCALWATVFAYLQYVGYLREFGAILAIRVFRLFSLVAQGERICAVWVITFIIFADPKF